MEISAPAQWINQTFAGFDVSVTTAVHKLYEIGGAFFTPFFEGISFIGKGGICLIIMSLLLMLYRPTRRFGTAMCLGLAIGAVVTNLIIKPWVARPRPYVDQSSIFYQYWLQVGQNVESDKSFPSGHTTAAFDCMTPVFILGNKRLKALALTFAILMGIARIYLCVHFPSDVLGGMIVGILAGILAVLIAKKLPQTWYEWEFGKKEAPAGKHEVH
jgi:undecaprenyl-diphosphatase